jgi:hypothetical protein
MDPADEEALSVPADEEAVSDPAAGSAPSDLAGDPVSSDHADEPAANDSPGHPPVREPGNAPADDSAPSWPLSPLSSSPSPPPGPLSSSPAPQPRFEPRQSPWGRPRDQRGFPPGAWQPAGTGQTGAPRHAAPGPPDVPPGTSAHRDISHPAPRHAAGAPAGPWHGPSEPGWMADRPAGHPATEDVATRHPPTEYPALPQTAVRRGPRRRRGRRRALGIALSIVVIGLVGVGSFVLATGRTDEVLAARGNQTPTPAASAAGTVTYGAFAGYPGPQRPGVPPPALESIAAANGEQVAVGTADGYPAIWRRGQGSSWSLASGAADGVLFGRPGIEGLTAVTHGPAGWLAVGNVVSGAPQGHPVVVTSPDGATWQAADGGFAFAVNNSYAYGAAAGPTAYVIVGKRITDAGRVVAATWWSAGLSGWTRGGNGGLDGRLMPSAILAVAAGPNGFIAVGSHGSDPAVWSSPNGRSWIVKSAPKPAGASSAVLSQIAVNGTRVVAAGDAVTSSGTVPFVEASADGGGHWQEVSLPGGHAAVTALTASGAGFTASGQSGPPGDHAAVVWMSGTGTAWVLASTIGRGVQEITGMTAAGNTVTGVGYAVTRLGEHPVLWTAPAP